MKDFQQSSLWQAALKPRPGDPYSDARTRLASTYELFWERTAVLAQGISKDLSGLTLHDETHLSALWDRAGQVTGSDYSLNPLEAFIFGGAVLLHDTGHAFNAYPGGIAELKQKLEYRDAVTAILRRKGVIRPDEAELANPSSEIADEALFIALRRLHAKQAEALATSDFRGRYLIGDQELRENLGQLIGRIAASHHWDRNSLGERLPSVQGAPGFMPQTWTIHPVKIACLLRCADAVQIDQRRAPAFAWAIHDPKGQSRLHWIAQQLAQPLVEAESDGGPGALVFTSQSDFGEDNADAWWIAYELLKNANEELQGCYQLMKDLGLPAFAVDRVAGAESPTHLAQRIRTTGWRPINAEVRVASVDQIVRLFGGSLLYGTDPAVPLRELIQNASDAVRARRAVAGDPLYEGKIVVTLVRNDNNTCRLIVEDDGIGMSERTLTGPLLEFGKSFWGSEEAQDEFPGLLSARLNQAGRFGIGFFSTLMIAERIEVTSRRWDTGLERTRKLTFREGLKLRPLVSTTVTAPLAGFSTRVELHISAEQAEALLTIYPGSKGYPKPNLQKIGIQQLVAHLCPTLDCDVWIRTDIGVTLAHSRKWPECDGLKWAREVTFGEFRTDEGLESYLSREAPFLQLLKDEDGKPAGRAAIAFGAIGSGINTIGRLSAVSRSTSQFAMSYVGSIDYEPGGPSRKIGVVTNKSEVETWASGQAELLSHADINDAEKYLAAMNVAHFGGDPTPLAKILITRKFASLSEVYDLLAAGNEIFIVLDRSNPSYPSIGMLNYWPTPTMGIGLAWNEVDFAVVIMEAWNGGGMPDRGYHRIPTETDRLPSCFLTCLARYVESKGHALNTEPVADVLFGRYTGKESPRENLVTGTELRGAAIKIWFAQ